MVARTARESLQVRVNQKMEGKGDKVKDNPKMMAGTQERSDKRRREDLLPMIYPESRLPKRIEADQMAARDFLDGDDEKMVATHDGGIVADEQWRQVASSITPVMWMSSLRGLLKLLGRHRGAMHRFRVLAPNLLH